MSCLPRVPRVPLGPLGLLVTPHSIHLSLVIHPALNFPELVPCPRILIVLVSPGPCWFIVVVVCI